MYLHPQPVPNYNNFFYFHLRLFFYFYQRITSPLDLRRVETLKVEPKLPSLISIKFDDTNYGLQSEIVEIYILCKRQFKIYK